MSSALNTCFLWILLKPKRKNFSRNINCKNKGKFVCEISIIILICQKLESVGPAQQKIKLLLPNTYLCYIESIYFSQCQNVCNVPLKKLLQ